MTTRLDYNGGGATDPALTTTSDKHSSSKLTTSVERSDYKSLFDYYFSSGSSTAVSYRPMMIRDRFEEIITQTSSSNILRSLLIRNVVKEEEEENIDDNDNIV